LDVLLTEREREGSRSTEVNATRGGESKFKVSKKTASRWRERDGRCAPRPARRSLVPVDARLGGFKTL